MRCGGVLWLQCTGAITITTSPRPSPLPPPLQPRPRPAPPHKHIHHRGFLIAQYCSSIPLLVLVLRSSHQIARHRTSEQCTTVEFEIKLRTAEYLEFTSTSPLHWPPALQSFLRHIFSHHLEISLMSAFANFQSKQANFSARTRTSAPSLLFFCNYKPRNSLLCFEPEY